MLVHVLDHPTGQQTKYQQFSQELQGVDRWRAEDKRTVCHHVQSSIACPETSQSSPGLCKVSPGIPSTCCSQQHQPHKESMTGATGMAIRSHLDVLGVFLLIQGLPVDDVGSGLTKVSEKLEGSRLLASCLLRPSRHLDGPVVLVELQEILQILAVLECWMGSLFKRLCQSAVNYRHGSRHCSQKKTGRTVDFIIFVYHHGSTQITI